MKFCTEKSGFEEDSDDEEHGIGSIHTKIKDCFIGYSEAEQVAPPTAARGH